MKASVRAAIAAAERVLPGTVAPEGQLDPRWQAIIEVGNFVETHPDDIWRFILRWGVQEDEDLRTAIATCLLEHLLEYHFEKFFPLVETTVQSQPLFADTFSHCWKFGQSETHAARFDALKRKAYKLARQLKRGREAD